MAIEAPPSTEPKGSHLMRALVEGVFPKDLGAPDAEQIAQQNLKRINSKSSPPAQPPVSSKLAPSESSQLKALEQFANPQPGVPEVSVVKPGGEPVVSTPAPEPVPEPLVTPEPTLAADLPDPGFADNDLLAALEKKPVAAKSDKADTTEKLLTGEAEPTPAAPEEDLDTPIVIPKKADELQAALIKTSKLLREKQKKIKELESRSSIDTAAIAVEPLQQRIQALEGELTQARNVSAGSKLENYPDFQRRYVQPVAMAENFINEIAKNNEGVSSRELFTATQEGDRVKRHAAVRAATTDLHPSDALQVEQAVDAIHEIGVERDKLKRNASQIMANIEKQQQEAMLTQQATMRAQSVKAHDAAFAEFMANPVLSQFAAKDPEVKKKLGAILDAAKHAEVDTSWVQNHEVRARAIQNALALPLVEKLYQNKLAEALTEVKNLRKKVLNLQAPSGLSTQTRNNYQAQESSAKTPATVEGIVKGVFAGKI